MLPVPVAMVGTAIPVYSPKRQSGWAVQFRLKTLPPTFPHGLKRRVERERAVSSFEVG